MKVSIITVVYNNERFIADAINSVLSQDYSNIEYIIIDGASKDNTLKTIDQYRDKITRVISEPDDGIYDAMNKGVHLATGDVIGILNSDDIYYDSHIISLVAEAFKNNPDVDGVYGNLIFCKAENLNHVVRKWISAPFKRNFFENGNIFPHPSLFVTKKVYETVGCYNKKYTVAADYDFMFRAFRVNKFKAYLINKFFVRMRLGGNSTGSLKNILLGNLDIYHSWTKNNISYPLRLFFLRPLKKIKQFF